MGDSFINSNFRLLCENRIEIGDGCAIAWDVDMLDTDRHGYNGKGEGKPIIIKDNVWVGHGASVHKGVTIGQGAVVAANATVTKNVEPHTFVAGVPAKQKDSSVEWS
jgi:acetyltransferase-like isoleucine patch superfamily enzyme